MGVYPNHGLEYWMEFDKKLDNNVLKSFIDDVVTRYNFSLLVTPANDVCILPMSRTDERLMKSSYYQQRKDDWFPHRTLIEQWWKPIEVQSSVDIELSSGERKIIDCIRQQFLQYITFEGWFDVNKIQYLY